MTMKKMAHRQLVPTVCYYYFMQHTMLMSLATIIYLYIWQKKKPAVDTFVHLEMATVSKLPTTKLHIKKAKLTRNPIFVCISTQMVLADIHFHLVLLHVTRTLHCFNIYLPFPLTQSIFCICQETFYPQKRVNSVWTLIQYLGLVTQF